MDFYTYMSARIPDFEKKLSMKDVEELKILFEQYKLWSETESNVLKLGMTPNSAGVDYTNDFAKTSARRLQAQKLLNETIINKMAQLQTQNEIDTPIKK